MSKTVLFYLEQLRKAPHDENVYHSLIELNNSYVFELIDAYYQEKNSTVQAKLVEVIWHHRSPETLTCLQDALHHDDPDVWKCALDGILAVNHPLGIKILGNEKARLRALEDKTAAERIEWIDEAYKQLQESLQNVGE